MTVRFRPDVIDPRLHGPRWVGPRHFRPLFFLDFSYYTIAHQPHLAFSMEAQRGRETGGISKTFFAVLAKYTCRCVLLMAHEKKYSLLGWLREPTQSLIIWKEINYMMYNLQLHYAKTVKMPWEINTHEDINQACQPQKPLYQGPGSKTPSFPSGFSQCLGWIPKQWQWKRVPR